MDAAYFGLSQYASDSYVECSCFSGLPTATLPAGSCAPACPDGIGNFTCGVYDELHTVTPVHAVSVYARAPALSPALCEATCR